MLSLSNIALLVRDYDEAIAYFVDTLGFSLVEDTKLGKEKRWVRIKTDRTSEVSILLARASNDEQTRFIGNQSGGRVFLFLQTDSFDEKYKQYKQSGVNFTEEPRTESYGKVAVFKDLYGNRWDLVEKKK